MKQHLCKSILSRFLVLTLIASVIAGAFSVSPAFADSPSGYSLYWDDFKTMVYGWASGNQSDTNTLDTLFSKVTSYWDDPKFNVFVISDPYGGYSMLLLYRTNGSAYCGSGWSGNEYQLTSGSYPSYFRLLGYFCYSRSQFRFIASLDQTISNPASRYGLIDLENVTNMQTMYPTPFEFNAVDYRVYSLRSMSSGNAGGYTMQANILDGSEIPPIFDFDVIRFNIGERWYITTTDQTYVNNMVMESESYYWWVMSLYANDIDQTFLSLILDSTDMVRLPYGQHYISTNLQNLSPAGVFAYDITQYIDSEWKEISDFSFYEITEYIGDNISDYRMVGESESSVSLDLTPSEEDPSMTEAWTQITQYYNIYNTTHVIPENLGEYLFGAAGSKMYPCTVSFPTEVTDAGSRSAVSQGIHTFKWKFGSLPDNIGFDYNLLDVVIVPESVLGKYGLIYFYDDTLASNSNFVDFVSFQSLLDMFDVIIIIPDDEDTLEENSWWVSAFGQTIFNEIDKMAVSGSSSMGIEYTTGNIPGNQFDGFALLTHKAIQKQMLWNFNDGLTKLYKLEVDYIDSEDKWKDSFLLWSASVFDMLDSVNGNLSSIKGIISSWNFSDWFSDLSLKLEQIADNTSETEVTPWYLSLWLWVLEFKPSNDDFSASLVQYDNNWEEFPELPAPSTVPLLPTIGG